MKREKVQAHPPDFDWHYAMEPKATGLYFRVELDFTTAGLVKDRCALRKAFNDRIMASVAEKLHVARGTAVRVHQRFYQSLGDQIAEICLEELPIVVYFWPNELHVISAFTRAFHATPLGHELEGDDATV